jgi:hypothetical protein
MHREHKNKSVEKQPLAIFIDRERIVSRGLVAHEVTFCSPFTPSYLSIRSVLFHYREFAVLE